MPTFKQTVRVRAPLSAVWQVHDDPKALKDLTPPPLRVKILEMDQPLRVGAQLKFRLVLFGPLGATWHAIYDEFEPYTPGATRCGFVDRALSSPFHAWTHRHTFIDQGDGICTMTDEATFQLVSGPLAAPVNWLIAYPAVASLFFYRRLATLRLLRQITGQPVRVS
jgi:ligand-binding SRPBCC domain-containing protein